MKNLITLLVVTSLMTACQSTQDNKNPASKVSQPNIIVFLVDDMGLMDTSVPFITDSKGKAIKQPLNDWYHTPNMEKLAEKGIRFSQFYAQSVCSPTRASLLTGQNSTRHHTTTWINPSENNHGKFGPKQWNWQGLKSSNITFPQLLKSNGYKTIHIGKGHFGPLNSEGAEPKSIGFDVNIAGAAWGRPKSYYGENNYGNHAKYKQKDKPLTHNIPHLEAYHGKDVFLTQALTLEANKQITQAVSEDKPFLLYMSHYAVHAPFDSDPRFAKRYKNRGMSKQAQAYATLVEGMDKSLGDISSTLEQLGIAENTLIIFLGDNGGDAPLGKNNEIASSAPLKGKKGTSWEGGMRAPFIAAWAKPLPNSKTQQRFPIATNTINTQVASVLDIYPTILSIAAVENPKSQKIDGVNLAKQLTGEININRDNDFLMHFPHEHRHSYFTSYRLENWKVIYNYLPKIKTKHRKTTIKQYQLFNLAIDPTESNNIASSQPKELSRMMKLMISKLEKQNAQYPIDKQGKTLKPILPTTSI
ncbi:sulfatase [Colwellia sp. 12G3]|uniref:sulfatase n=1 Tax=Colwellia sp. 12G3 TaxID=2058299 RepID=UPI000C341FD3|nr:sulfatase [Colwellia sp. 12G3]PKI16647.1 N-acetylgalactosamine-6-sulfatase [Colwellia sp. 12G3]